MERREYLEILPFLFSNDDDGSPEKVTPSKYIKELTRSTKERTDRLLHHEAFTKKFIQDNFPYTFKPSLPVVIFQSFVPENQYAVTLRMLNTDNVTRYLTMSYEKSPYFSISYSSQAMIKVAPGMSEKFLIKFKPVEKKDYYHKVSFLCDEGSFDIPLIAIGPRPLLDFPDSIEIGECPVNFPTTNFFCVFNKGEVDAVFKLVAPRPFQVQPDNACVKSGENIQMSVTFDCAKAGFFQEFIKIIFANGEELCCSISAMARNSIITMSDDKLAFEDTFMGLSRKKIVSIHNQSSHVVNFKWKQFSSVEEDKAEAERREKFIHETSGAGDARSSQEIFADSHGSLTAIAGFSSGNYEECNHDSELLFRDSCFSFLQKKGDIWPGGSTDIQVIFKPNIGPKVYECVAYCETSGCEGRHKLVLSGSGLGPAIDVYPQYLDIGGVYATVKNCYEVIVKNKGDIAGQIEFISKALDFSGSLECSPETLFLEPGQHKAFALSYIGLHAGQIIEEVEFKIYESGEVRKLFLSGTVQFAELKPAKASINLGVLPVSFPTVSTVVMENQALIPLSFVAFVAGDKSVHQSLTSDWEYSYSSWGDHSSKEVFIDPPEGYVKPNENIDLNIRVLPEAQGSRTAHVVVDMWEGKTSPLVIPVTYQSKVPEVSLDPMEIIVNSCYFNQKYEQNITLTNKSDCPAKYFILLDEIAENEALSVTLDTVEGVLAELSSEKIPIFIEVSNVGKVTCSLKVEVPGMADMLTCKITCEGQGPMLAAEVNELCWGDMPLFVSNTKSFRIQNYSPTVAMFSCEMKNSSSPWNVEPKQGFIDPLGVTAISVHLFMINRGIFEDLLIISVGDTYDLTISVSATGYGTSIVADPPISPVLDLGKIFCFSSFCKGIKFTNYGCCKTTILFNHGNKKMKKSTSGDCCSVFDFSPSKLILDPGDCDYMYLQASHDRAEVVSEKFWFWSYDEGLRKRERILDGVISALFIPLLVTFSPERIDLLSCKNSVVRDILTVTNETCLGAMFTFITEHPFSIINGEASHASLEVDVPSHESADVLIEFDPSFLDDNRSRTYHGTVKIAVENMPQEFQYHVKISGHVEFPHVSVHCGEMDFGCIVVGSIEKRTIQIVNDSIFPAEFHWKWMKGFAFVGWENSSKKRSITNGSFSEDQNEFSEYMVDVLVSDVKQAREDYFRRLNEQVISNYCDIIEDDDNEKHISLMLSEYERSFPVSWVFDVMPKYGILDPHQSLDASILFRGHVPIRASATLCLEVTNGASEMVVLSAKSFNISYSLDKTCINLEGKIFCLAAYDKIEFTNRGDCGFYFSIDYIDNDLDGPESENYEEPCRFVIHPSSGFLDGHSSVTLEVSCIPGKFGYFIGVCKLCLPVVEPIHINVCGNGLLPQVFLHLPKDLDSSCEDEWSRISEYIGISHIGEDWKLKDTIHDIDWSMYVSHDLEELVDKDWVWIAFEDEFPTNSVICLAIELEIASQYVKDYPLCAIERSSMPSATSLSGLTVPPYAVSMGTVIIGQEYTYSVMMENFGPVAAQVCVRKEIIEKMYGEGFAIEWPKKKLSIGETVAVEIAFFPTRNSYPDNHYNVKSTLYIDVIYGVCIPINIYAEVTIPFVSLEETMYNFDQVRCGQCSAHSVLLQNRGWVECDWKSSITPVRRTKTKIKNKCNIQKMDNKEKYTNPFSVSPEMGELKPGEFTMLQVIFEPHCGGPFEAELIIKVMDNPDDNIITLKGIGLDPVLKFNSLDINFDPIIPATETSTAYIYIKNPNKYPVEIFLPLYDGQIYEEERIFQLLLHYYNADDLMIPALPIGEPYSKEFRDFYLWISELLIKEVYKQSQPHASVVSIERPSKNSRRRSSATRSKKSLSSSILDEKMSLDIFDPSSEKNQLYFERALEKYFSGEIMIPASENKAPDPLSKSIENLTGNENKKMDSVTPKDSLTLPEFTKSASVFIFHGAPYSDSIQIAHRAARKLGLPILKPDDVIIEEAVSGVSATGSEINSLLLNLMNDFFSKLPQQKLGEIAPSTMEASKALDSDVDPVEEFSNKVATYLVETWKADTIKKTVEDADKKSPPPGKTKGSKSSKASSKASAKSSKGSSKSKKKTKPNDSGTEEPVVEEPTITPLSTTLWTDLPCGLHFSNIPEFFIEDILSSRIHHPEFHNGFVVPTLWSVFFPSVDRMLMILLKILSKHFLVHCTFILNTFDNHINILKEKKRYTEGKESHKEEPVLNVNVSEKHQYMPLLEELSNFLKNESSAPKESDEYLQVVKIKLNQLRKFFRAMEFVEMDKISSRKGKKTPTFIKRRTLSGESDSLKKSGAGTDAKKTRKKGVEESKSKTTKPVSTRKLKMKKGELEEKREEIGVSMPFPLEVCDAIGLDIGQTVNLWNQFDDFDSDLKNLLILLENWSEILERKLFPSDKEKLGSTSRDSKGRANKAIKRPSLFSALNQSRRKSRDSQKVMDDFVGIPVVIVNTSDIESDLTKSFLHNLTYPRGVKKNESADVNIAKSPDVTFLHIKKQWFNRMKDLLENSFSINSLDATKVSLDIVKMPDTIIEGEGITSPEDFSQNYKSDSLVLPSEERIQRNSETGRDEVNKIVLSENQWDGSENVNPKEYSLLKSSQARQIIGPGESVGYGICYSPNEKGVHKSSFTIELHGWQKSYTVNLSGIGDVPQIDIHPKVIFSKCALEKPKAYNALYSPTYFHNVGALDFGLLPVEKKLYVSAVSKLTFKNISQVPVKAKFMLQPNQGNFFLDKEELEIKPEEFGNICITACPKYSHLVQDTLVCTVSDNPELINLKLSSTGYKVKVQLLPKQLNFEKVLIYRKKWLTLMLNNLCASSLYWRIASSEFIEGGVFIAKPVEGMLELFSTTEIEVEFSPEKVQVVPKKPLCIELFAKMEDSEPLLSETVNVSGEAYDINVDINFAYCDKTSPSFMKALMNDEEEIEPNHLDFGLMKAETDRCMLIALGNRGKCSVNFAILVDENIMQSLGIDLSQIFDVLPQSGTLEVGSRNSTIVLIKCFATVEVDIQHLPILKCRLIDPNVPQVENQVVADIPVNVTLKAVYSKYNLKPYTGLNFGVVKTGTRKTLTIVIHNSGEYEFSFNIKKPLKDPSEETKEAEIVNNKRTTGENPSASPKGKNKGLTIPTELTIDCFRIIPSSGIIHSNQDRSILVHCEPQSEGTFYEAITVSVSDTHPSNPPSKMFLSASSFSPAVDFSDPEKIFIEHVVCQDFLSFKWPSKAISYIVYSKEDNELAFKGVYVNHTVEARLCVHNYGLTPADVEISVQPCEEDCASGCNYIHKESTDKEQAAGCFDVAPEFVKIPPCCDGWITVLFSPCGTEVYCAHLEITVESDSESPWNLLLSGEGLLPELTLTYPADLQKNMEGKYPFILPERLLGSFERFIFSFKNTGCIMCKVIIEFNGDKRFFKIFPEEKTENFLKEFQLEAPLKKLTSFDLGPGEEVSFWFSFFGHHTGSFKEDLFIYAIGNPFGSIVIEIDAVCISEGVHIQGLDHVKKHFYNFGDTWVKNLSSTSSLNGDKEFSASSDPSTNAFDGKTSLKAPDMEDSVKSVENASSMHAMHENASSLHAMHENTSSMHAMHENASSTPNSDINIFSRYLLDFKKSYVRQGKEIRFWLLNHSEIYYAFRWFGVESVPQLLLYPHKGVIEAFSSVTITAVILSEEPIFIDQALLRCYFLEMHARDDSNCFRGDVEEIVIKKENTEPELKIIEEETIYNLIERNTNINSANSSEVKINEQNIEKMSVPESNRHLDEGDIDNLQNKREKFKFMDFEAGKKKVSKKSKVDRKTEVYDGSEKFFSIDVIMSAVVDYPMCTSTAPSEMTFGNVPVFETRTNSVALTNVGKVPLKFIWKFRSLVYLSLSKGYKHKYGYCEIARRKKRRGKRPVTFVCLRGRRSKQYYLWRYECTFKPFQVNPCKGLLKEDGGTCVCKITFTPQSTGYHKAIVYCRVNKPCQRRIVSKILLEGIGKRKQYHFDFVKSNEQCDLKGVLPSKQLLSEVCCSSGPPDPENETVELRVVGVGVTHCKKIQFHNLSRKRSVFNWKNVDEEDLNSLEWRCNSPNGIIHPKSLTEMEFAFTPLELGVFESNWSFSLFHCQKRCLHKTFHFIGMACEPAVYFTENCLKIYQSVSGQTTFKNTCLVNEEEMKIRFRVYGNAKVITNEIGTLRIKPEKGILEPKSSTKIRLSYTPEKSGNTCFHVKFKIQRRPSPLVVTIFCDSYEIRAEARFILPAFSLVKHLSEDGPNDIKIGRIQEKTAISGTFELYNRGLNAFDYSWSYMVSLAREIGLDLKMTNVEGKVPPDSKVDCILTVSLSRKSRIENYPLELKVSKGPTYHIYVSMVASAPLCKFSFVSHNFGPCLASELQPDARGREVVLIVTGYDKNPVILECNFKPLEHLTVDFKKAALLFNESAKIPITFSPQDYVKYRTVIPFTVNGRWKRSVVITGQGVPLKLELVSPHDKIIDFKTVKAGECTSKSVRVISKTLVPIDVYFGLSNEAGSEDDWKSITILPYDTISMAKNDVINIQVIFSPIERMARFTEKVVAFVKDLPEEHPLFICHGSCEEVDIVLNSPCVQFGPVPKGITAVSYVSLMNSGDIGKRYQWDRKKKLKKQFSISPTLGFLNPNQGINFRITFRPTSANSYFKCKICCELKQYRKIYLDLSGFGTDRPSPSESIIFSTFLREHDRKFVTIKNSSDDVMELIPYLRGEHFNGANVLLIEPSSESVYEVCYNPKSVKGSREHHGELYFHLPTGENYSWKLIGTVNPPLPCSTVKRDVHSRIIHSEILCIENCLALSQRFHIHTELVLGECGEPAFSITGYSGVSNKEIRRSIDQSDSKKSKNEFQTKMKDEGKIAQAAESNGLRGTGEPGGFIDVPAYTEASYKVNFIGFKECELHFKVYFVCEETGEYQYHELFFNVIEKKPDVFKIVTSAFKNSCRSLDVVNPWSSSPLEFSFNCDLDFISLPEPIIVQPNSKESVILEFFPLVDGHFEGTLKIVCPEIGDLSHVLDVRVYPIPPDEYLCFEFHAPLGSTGGPSMPIVLSNYSKTDVCFSCQVDSSEFIVDKYVFVGAESEEILDVIYEPSEIGFAQGILEAESEIAGFFGFKLCGKCSPPKIKGPCKVIANSEGVDIVFRNVLKAGMNFSFTVTEPFNVNTTSAWIESKEEEVITVSLDLSGVDGIPSLPITGSLTIMPLNKEICSSTRWEYYLEGVIEQDVEK